MVQNRAAGNGNFDIDAIRMAANAMDANAPPQGRYGTLLDDMDREEASRLGLDSREQLAIIRDISSMIEELQANRSAGAGNELEGLITRIAGRLPPGMSTAAANAIMMEVERRDRNEGGVFSSAEWDRIKDEVKKERAEQARIADFADDAQNATQRMTPEQWDSAPSREYPGMTNAEALTAIRRINGNLPFYSQLAVQRGLIRPEQEADFQTYMRNQQWLMEQERAGNTETPEYRARRQEQDTARTTNPNFETASRSVVNAANDRGIVPLTESPAVGATANVVGSAALDTRTNVFGVDAGAPPAVPVSVAATLDRADGAVADRPPLTATFNSSANGATPPPPAAAVAPTTPAPPRVAAAGFDQSTGMI